MTFLRAPPRDKKKTSPNFLIAMDFFLYCTAIWFFFYLINHSLIFQKVRLAAMPALPQWMQTMISCAFCLAFWITAALSLFTGFSAVVFAAPPCVLFADLAYRKLGGITSQLSHTAQTTPQASPAAKTPENGRAAVLALAAGSASSFLHAKDFPCNEAEASGVPHGLHRLSLAILVLFGRAKASYPTRWEWFGKQESAWRRFLQAWSLRSRRDLGRWSNTRSIR